LCEAQGVKVNPTMKIRPPIDRRFIEQNCTNANEHPPAGNSPQHQSPPPLQQSFIHQVTPSSSSSMEAMNLAHMEHLKMQQSDNHREMIHLHWGLYNSIPQEQPNSWMNLDQLESYVAWPRDKYYFLMEASLVDDVVNYFNAGTNRGEAGPSTNVNEEFDTELDELLIRD